MQRTALLTALAIAGTASCSKQNPPTAVAQGLVSTACWFDTNDYYLPAHACYFMQVNETPNLLTGRLTSFPVIIFRAENTKPYAAPLLHLGGGGPGGSLYLDSEYNVLSIYEEMRSLSVEAGRDLYLIDPRGAGQSTPSMMCQTFVDNVFKRWGKKLTVNESYESAHENMEQCLETLRNEGANFGAYSSLIVINDLEQLRKAEAHDEWVLYGASYASVYAQLYARDYPDRVASMILDSATFLDVPRHEVLVRETVEPYKRLFNYCSYTQSCGPEHSQEKVSAAFWKRVKALDEEPLRVTLTFEDDSEVAEIYLTGWRFLDSVLWGVYSEEIFTDLPIILDELERGETAAIKPYIVDLLLYLLDETFGDISAESHYCVDSHPYVDQEKTREQVELIPYPYARDIARLGLSYGAHCKYMNISQERGTLDQAIVTAVPTLFIHGTQDSVTLLEHVLRQQKNFSNSHVVTSSQAHIVLDDPCVQKTAKAFLEFGLSKKLNDHCEQH